VAGDFAFAASAARLQQNFAHRLSKPDNRKNEIIDERSASRILFRNKIGTTRKKIKAHMPRLNR